MGIILFSCLCFVQISNIFPNCFVFLFAKPCLLRVFDFDFDLDYFSHFVIYFSPFMNNIITRENLA